MNIRQQLRFAPRLLWREWQDGELTVLLLALLIAIVSHTAIGHFAERITGAMAQTANNIIGGDLVLSSSHPIADNVMTKAETLNLEVAEVQRFITVVNAADDILLVSVKSVSASYPLKGSLKVSTRLFGDDIAIDSGPAAGDVWVESRVLQALDIALGDTLQIGEATFVVRAILTYEPDRGNSFYSFNPRVMIGQDDLARTQIVQPGSRVWYRHLYAGEQPAIAAMRAWLQQNLQPGQRISSLNQERPAVSNALQKAKQYLGLASLLALLLAAVAIANSGRHYSERHYDTSALLRCLGCGQNDILGIYLIQLGLIALFGAVAGNLLGWLAQQGLFIVVADLLPGQIPDASYKPVLSGAALSFIVLLGFTLPSILRLKSVSPQRVLRQDLTPLALSGWMVYGGATLLVMLMMWFYTGSLVLTLSLIAGAIVVVAVVSIGILGLFKLTAKSLPILPVNWRAGVRNFLRRRRQTIAQTVAFGLTIMAMLVVVLLRTELIATWKATIPDNAPNHFVLNIQTSETADYQFYISDNGINAERLYPIIRGRLLRINATPIIEHVSKHQRHNHRLSRELNLTWSATIPLDNVIVDGDWWVPDAAPEQKLVSVEKALADALAIKVGDTLTFFTGDHRWQATVSSLRSVKWDNFNPNFYMIFNPGALDRLPVTWINSFFIAPERKQILVGLVKQFPAVTVLEMDAILKQVKSIITQVTLAIESILSFVLFAGLVVTLSIIQSSMNDRLREGALIRTLGANRKLIKINQWCEFSSMGFVAGLIGVSGAEIIIASLYRRIFALDYSPTWWAWIVTPLIAALLIGLVGVLSSRRVLQQPPMRALRELRA